MSKFNVQDQVFNSARKGRERLTITLLTGGASAIQASSISRLLSACTEWFSTTAASSNRYRGIGSMITAEGSVHRREL